MSMMALPTLVLGLDSARQSTAHRRLNVGSGECPILYWTNLDPDLRWPADRRDRVPPLPYADGSLDEVYAGHFLEHLSQEDATVFLAECFRCITPGGRLGVVVPDTRIILERWLAGAVDSVEWPRGVWHAVADLDEVCALFLYSTVQHSPHRWSYDLQTLGRALRVAGFDVTDEIDRYRDPRLGSGAWYQCGLNARRP
jgi:predicted SAM-dependent methyltransferase